MKNVINNNHTNLYFQNFNKLNYTNNLNNKNMNISKIFCYLFIYR